MLATRWPYRHGRGLCPDCSGKRRGIPTRFGFRIRSSLGPTIARGEADRSTAFQVCEDPGCHAEHVPQELDSSHFGWGAVGHDSPRIHDDDTVRVIRGVHEVVEHHHHRHAAARAKRSDEVEDLELMADIEKGGRLVQEERAGALAGC